MIGASFDGLVCDLDGVIYRGDEPIAGAAEAVARLQKRGVDIVFCTNNSRSTVEQYLTKLARLGIDTGADRILSSAVVTGEVLAQRDLSGARALVVGGGGIDEALRTAGIEPIGRSRSGTVDLVVVGWDLEFTYDKMRDASSAVRAGATFIATNDDATFPAPDGLWPGTGAILASIERASGRRAEVMGKPHRPMMEAAAHRLAGASQIAVVGDRADTDLAGGKEMGWTTILVLSGVTSKDEVDAIEPRPDQVIVSLADL